MVSWFERDGAFARYELYQLANGRYELRILGADGTESAEYFDSSIDVDRRCRQLDQEFTAGGWSGPHGMIR
jgi:hypothetical protein